jgi:DNA-binding MarR family transcriptional regulator
MSSSPPSAVRASQRVRAVIGPLRRRIRAVSGSDDVSLTRATVLARLIDNEGLAVSDLATAEGMRHQSMAAIVARLEELGLVERRRDPSDGRRQLMALTADGRRRAEADRQARGEWLASQFELKCTEDERQTVIAAMAVLERIIHD